MQNEVPSLAVMQFVHRFQVQAHLLICCLGGVDRLLAAAEGLGGVAGSFMLLLPLLPGSPMFLLLLLLLPPSLSAAGPLTAAVLLMLLLLVAAALSTMAGMGDGISSSLRTCN
jgi:hypothetical protein